MIIYVPLAAQLALSCAGVWVQPQLTSLGPLKPRGELLGKCGRASGDEEL